MNSGFIQNTGDTNQPAQMTGLGNFNVDPIFTVGETISDYAPPGILDGLGAFKLDDDTVRVVANHELRANLGYTYTLANGTELTGARVSYFDINIDTRELEGSGLAYDTIINRAGEVVDEATDLEFEGINRLCSAQYIEAHQFGEGRGLEDGLFFTGEETGGGTEFVIDPNTNTMYAVPWLGRAAWESVTELDTGTTDKVAILVGDDRGGAPLLMYVGTKNTASEDLLERNGLVGGQLYVWAADTGETTPEEFNGTGESRDGSWVAIDFYDPELAGTEGYDELGFANQDTQDALAEAAGAFKFSRPEDVATNPDDGTQAVLASTGRSSLFPADSWGTTYIIDTQFGEDGTPLSANIEAIYDGDDAGNSQFAEPDLGLRSPDNLEWADDGSIYLQEDRSFGEFGLTSGEEASIWQLDPTSGSLTRVAQMNRDSIPEGQTDPDGTDIGRWESSGIIDVSELFGEDPGELFLFDVQAHSLRDGSIEEGNLVEGGQLAFLINEAPNTILGTDETEILVGTNGNDVIRTLRGDDTVVGLDGFDTIFGGPENDALYGGDEADSLLGRGGDDILNGGDDADFLDGSSGADTLDGGNGFDNLLGGSGEDVLNGGNEQDTLLGGAARDVLAGGNGSDLLNGGKGNDILNGDDGFDTLNGASGRDFLDGGNGSDTLIGALGADILTGGAGNDVFVFRTADLGSIDQISDFEVGQDLIDLSQIFARPIYGSSTPIEDYVTLIQSGSDTEVQIDLDGDRLNRPSSTFVVLTGVDSSTINADDFII